jgi:aldehyde dehydrogenase (NAD+)
MIGKYVAASAAKNLTPCILELGGKCPCVVDEDADLASTANKIVWGKFFNAGQTCIAPDFLFAHKSITQKLIDALKESMYRQLGKSLEYNQSETMALMIN